MPGYDSAWQTSFLAGPIGSRVDSDFTTLVCDPAFTLADYDVDNDFNFTDSWPCVKPRDNLHSKGWCSILPFYYIEQLQADNPDIIYDLGCGNNFFSSYYSNITGVDLNIGEVIDDDWISERAGTMKALVSLNGLSMQNPSDISRYKDLLTDDGKGVITFSGRNFLTPIDDSDTEVTIKSLVNVIEYETVDQDVGFDGATRIIFSR